MAKAIILVSDGIADVKERPIPTLPDDCILVRVKAVGVNPTDWKHRDFQLTEPGSCLGCDYAGIVEDVGSKVTKQFTKGDRVCGVAHGGDVFNHDNGAFSEYIVVKGHLQIQTPDNLTDVDAATLGISVCTVAQGLYQVLNFPLPTQRCPEKDEYILIYGGSTATGIFGIQFARLSGYKVITTSSPHNFDYLKSLGAEEVFDYKTVRVAEDIKDYTKNGLRIVWDCTGLGGTICAKALSSTGGKYSTIMELDVDISKINANIDGPHRTLMYSVFGHEYKKGPQVTLVSPEDAKFAAEFWDISRKLLADGQLRVPRTVVNSGGDGLYGVLKGLEMLKEDRVSASKLVYTL